MQCSDATVLIVNYVLSVQVQAQAQAQAQATLQAQLAGLPVLAGGLGVTNLPTAPGPVITTASGETGGQPGLLPQLQDSLAPLHPQFTQALPYPALGKQRRVFLKSEESPYIYAWFAQPIHRC